MTTDHPGHGPAIDAITRLVARARDEGWDGEVTARHILVALEGAGWRRRIEPPPSPGSGPLDLATNTALAAKARAGIQARDGER